MSHPLHLGHQSHHQSLPGMIQDVGFHPWKPSSFQWWPEYLWHNLCFKSIYEFFGNRQHTKFLRLQKWHHLLVNMIIPISSSKNFCSWYVEVYNSPSPALGSDFTTVYPSGFSWISTPAFSCANTEYGNNIHKMVTANILMKPRMYLLFLQISPLNCFFIWSEKFSYNDMMRK